MKYRTVKLAEVGRLMQLLGAQLARKQAGLSAQDVDVVMGDAAAATPAEVGSGAVTPAVGGQESKAGAAGTGGAGGGGGKGGKKKKGKR